MSPKSALCAACVALSALSLAHAGDEDRTILLLLKDVPGAPTPTQIIEYTNIWPHVPNPPLQAFNIKDPQSALYLLPDRATGDFLAWLGANPNSARAKLEAYQLLLYPSAVEIPAALAALQADPYVESASVPQLADLPVAAANEIAFDQPTSLEISTQYGWDDMNLAVAWISPVADMRRSHTLIWESL